MPVSKFTEPVRQQIVLMLKNGVSHSDIARAFCVNQSTITRLAAKLTEPPQSPETHPTDDPEAFVSSFMTSMPCIHAIQREYLAKLGHEGDAAIAWRDSALVAFRARWHKPTDDDTWDSQPWHD